MSGSRKTNVEMISGPKVVEMIYYHTGNDNRTQRIHLGIKRVGKLQLTLVVLGVLVAAFPETAKQQETWEGHQLIY
jgi:hypothetical protein